MLPCMSRSNLSGSAAAGRGVGLAPGCACPTMKFHSPSPRRPPSPAPGLQASPRPACSWSSRDARPCSFPGRRATPPACSTCSWGAAPRGLPATPTPPPPLAGRANRWRELSRRSLSRPRAPARARGQLASSAVRGDQQLGLAARVPLGVGGGEWGGVNKARAAAAWPMQLGPVAPLGAPTAPAPCTTLAPATLVPLQLGHWACARQARAAPTASAAGGRADEACGGCQGRQPAAQHPAGTHTHLPVATTPCLACRPAGRRLPALRASNLLGLLSRWTCTPDPTAAPASVTSACRLGPSLCSRACRLPPTCDATSPPIPLAQHTRFPPYAPQPPLRLPSCPTRRRPCLPSRASTGWTPPTTPCMPWTALPPGPLPPAPAW